VRDPRSDDEHERRERLHVQDRAFPAEDPVARFLTVAAMMGNDVLRLVDLMLADDDREGALRLFCFRVQTALFFEASSFLRETPSRWPEVERFVRELAEQDRAAFYEGPGTLGGQGPGATARLRTRTSGGGHRIRTYVPASWRAIMVVGRSADDERRTMPKSKLAKRIEQLADDVARIDKRAEWQVGVLANVLIEEAKEKAPNDKLIAAVEPFRPNGDKSYVHGPSPAAMCAVLRQVAAALPEDPMPMPVAAGGTITGDLAHRQF
jgi:hypothetical protein